MFIIQKYIQLLNQPSNLIIYPFNIVLDKMNRHYIILKLIIKLIIHSGWRKELSIVLEDIHSIGLLNALLNFGKCPSISTRCFKMELKLSIESRLKDLWEILSTNKLKSVK